MLEARIAPAAVASIALGGLDGTNGFKLVGVANFDLTGRSVSTAGDVNGDGFADLIVGADTADAGGTDRGTAYVVFGKAGGFGTSLPLGTLDGTDGFKLTGVADADFAGISVSTAGDVNGDGFDDLIVGATGADEGGTNRGAAYVVLGKASGFAPSLSLGALDGSNGFRLAGAADNDRAGYSVSAAGDVNGDGFGDLIVGAIFASEGGGFRGAAYVVFGKAGGFAPSLALASLDGTNGFKLAAAADGDFAGVSVSAAGDINGDGFGDLLVGAHRADEGGYDRGAAYVVFGKASGFGASLPLSSLDGTNGFKLAGVSDYDYTGRSVSNAGDINGDGFDDLIVGALRAIDSGLNRGAAYVVFGFGAPDVTIAANGKSATFTDWDGDRVTLTTTKGTLDAAQFKLSAPNPLTGGSHLLYADFTAATTGTEFTRTTLTFTAKRGPAGGDGLVNLGTLDARGVTLGKITVDGDLQQLDAAGATALTTYSLGQFAKPGIHGAPLTSEITGRLGALTIKTDATRITLTAQTIGPIQAANLDGVTILAQGFGNPGTPAAALVIKSLTITGSVKHSHLLAGYNPAGTPVNADVQIGKILIGGQWIASNLVAGAQAGPDGHFGTADDTLIPGGNAIVAKIARLTVGGALLGTPAHLRDAFGLVAEQFGTVSLGKAKLPLQPGARNDTTPLLLTITGDLRLREVA